MRRLRSTAAKSGADTVSASALGITASQNVAVSISSFSSRRHPRLRSFITVTASPTNPLHSEHCDQSKCCGGGSDWTSSTVPVPMAQWLISQAPAERSVRALQSQRGQCDRGDLLDECRSGDPVRAGTGVSATQTITLCLPLRCYRSWQKPSPTTVQSPVKATLTAIGQGRDRKPGPRPDCDFSLTESPAESSRWRRPTTDIGGVAQSSTPRANSECPQWSVGDGDGSCPRSAKPHSDS